MPIFGVVPFIKLQKTTLKQQLNDEKWDVKLIHWSFFGWAMSSASKNARMTMSCNRCDVINSTWRKTQVAQKGDREKGKGRSIWVRGWIRMCIQRRGSLKVFQGRFVSVETMTADFLLKSTRLQNAVSGCSSLFLSPFHVKMTPLLPRPIPLTSSTPELWFFLGYWDVQQNTSAMA